MAPAWYLRPRPTKIDSKNGNRIDVGWYAPCRQNIYLLAASALASLYWQTLFYFAGHYSATNTKNCPPIAAWYWSPACLPHRTGDIGYLPTLRLPLRETRPFQLARTFLIPVMLLASLYLALPLPRTLHSAPGELAH